MDRWIAVDWGTSSFRAYLIEDDVVSDTIETRDGIKFVKDNKFENTFINLIKKWLTKDKKIDMVDVFRRSDECLELAKDTIKIKAKVFWMQLNIFNKEAFNLVTKNNIQCVYDKCPKIEYSRIFNELENI